MRTSLMSKWLKRTCSTDAVVAVTTILSTTILSTTILSTATLSAYQEPATASPVVFEVVDDPFDAPAETTMVAGEAVVEVEKVRLTADERRDKKRQERTLNSIWKTQEVVEGFEPVNMFVAVDTGEIDVVIKTKSAAEANLMVTNNSDRPLAIEMPPAFAAAPVLRQRGGGGAGGGRFRGGQQGGFGGQGGQIGGGGFGGGQQGGGFGGGGGQQGGFGGGGGGGIFNIPPGRVGRIGINTVCLEHGRPDPALRMDYTVIPLESFSTDPKIFEVCRMLANDEIGQNVAQAAAWNIADELPWEFLLTKNRIERMDGSYERFFSPNQLYIAHQAVAVAAERAEARLEQQQVPTQSPGEIREREEAAGE